MAGVGRGSSPLAGVLVEGRGAARGRLTPVQQFTLLLGVSLIVGTIVLGGALALLLKSYVEDETIALTRREVEVHFLDIFGDAIFTRQLTPAEAARFDPMVRSHFGIYDIVQLRLYTNDGTMIYNYLPGLRPDRLAPDAGAVSVPPEQRAHVAHAASGSLVLSRTRLSADQNIRQRPLADVLEVYVPIRSRAGEIVGVAEVYRDVERQIQAVRRLQFLVGAIVAASALLLFVSLIGIFRDSTRRLRRQSDALAQSMLELQATHGATLEALVAALEARDHETQGHSERVTQYAVVIGEALGLDGEHLSALQRGALLHDIGKIGVPDAILRKPGPLDAHEWEQMRRHPEFGARMVSGISFLAEALPVVRHHHERYDGSGYPDRLVADAIPLPARVFAVADSFDAMTSDRPYRRSLPLAQARAEIKRCAGTQFDPVVVEAFLAIPETELAAIRERSLAAGSAARLVESDLGRALAVV